MGLLGSTSLGLELAVLRPQAHECSSTALRDSLAAVIRVGPMKNPIQLFYKHIVIAKVLCLTLLFSPLWGFWWFNINPELWAGVGHYFVLTLWIQYLFKSLPITIAYSSVCLLAFVSFVIVTFIRPTLIRVPLMIVLLIGWAFELSILDLRGFLSDQDLWSIFWQERTTGPEAVGAYAPYIARDLLFVAILGVVLCASPARGFSVPAVFGLLPILSLALVAGMIVYTKGGTQTFPIPFGTFSNAAIVLESASKDRTPGLPRFVDPALLRYVSISHDINVESAVNPIFDKIVVIMDESVRGDYISMNDASHNATPFLKSANHLVNFGVAISGGNCSHLSRTMFRFGMRPSTLPNGWRDALRKPTFWQFAHRAGYATVHIDAGNNTLTTAEKTLVDSNFSIFENPGYLRDQKLVGQLLRALKDERPAFIYVQKYGVHFPYSTKYPPYFHAFPTPPRTPTRTTRMRLSHSSRRF